MPIYEAQVHGWWIGQDNPQPAPIPEEGDLIRAAFEAHEMRAKVQNRRAVPHPLD